MDNSKIEISSELFLSARNENIQSTKIILVESEQRNDYLSNQIISAEGSYYLCFYFSNPLCLLSPLIIRISADRVRRIKHEVTSANEGLMIYLDSNDSEIQFNLAIGNATRFDSIRYYLEIYENKMKLKIKVEAGCYSEGIVSDNFISLDIGLNHGLNIYDEKCTLEFEGGKIGEAKSVYEAIQLMKEVSQNDTANDEISSL